MSYLGVFGFLSTSKVLQRSIINWVENFGVVKLLSCTGFNRQRCTAVRVVGVNPIADKSALVWGSVALGGAILESRGSTEPEEPHCSSLFFLAY